MKKTNNKPCKKKKIIIISVIVALSIALIATAVGLLAYFNSPMRAAERLYKAIEEKDGEAFSELIAPSERDYINSLLSPLDLTIKDTVAPINEAIFSSSEKNLSLDDLEYTKKDDKATFKIKPDNGAKGVEVNLDFKKEGGKWYFSPSKMMTDLPIKTSIKILGAIKQSSADDFLECVLPSESWKIKFGLSLFDLDKVIKNIADSFGIGEEGSELPKISSVEKEENKMVITLTREEGEKIKIVFVNSEGEWYLSVADSEWNKSTEKSEWYMSLIKILTGILK